MPTLDELRAGRLPLGFYQRDALVVARALLGQYLVSAPTGEAPRVVRIVETEAYRGTTDRACHASKGLTKRTKTLLGPAGHAYVYLIYGIYDCFNVVAGGAKQRGHAVLVRGAEPVLGIAEGARTDGPGRLTRAMALTRAHDASPLSGDELFLSAGKRPRTVHVTPRVGVAYAGEDAELEYRFFDPSSRFVSRPSPGTIGLGGTKPAPPRHRSKREEA